MRLIFVAHRDCFHPDYHEGTEFRMGAEYIEVKVDRVVNSVHYVTSIGGAVGSALQSEIMKVVVKN